MFFSGQFGELLEGVPMHFCVGSHIDEYSKYWNYSGHRSNYERLKRVIQDYTASTVLEYFCVVVILFKCEFADLSWVSVATTQHNLSTNQTPTYFLSLSLSFHCTLKMDKSRVRHVRNNRSITSIK
jgi:hypothetical protein